MRRERDRQVGAEHRGQFLLDLGRVAMARHPVRVTFSSTVTKCVSSVAARPAPDTPDLASITTSSIRPARASGASASSAAVG